MSTKTTTPRRNPTRTRDYLGTRALGFSLVELIVGMSIAVLCIGVIYQTMANSSRTVSFAAGATDADTSAKMTLYMLEEQINRAGFGLTGFGDIATKDAVTERSTLPGTLDGGARSNRIADSRTPVRRHHRVRTTS